MAVILIYLLVSTVHPQELAQAVRGFNWVLLWPLAGSYVIYLLCRALRWHFLLRPMQAPNSVADSLLLFSAAQAAVLVPAGQFLLPLLQKRQHGTLIGRSVATVLVQEIIFGVLVLPAALPGIHGYPLGGFLLLSAFLLSTGAVFILLHDGTANAGIFCANLVPFLRKKVPDFRDLRNYIVALVNTREALVGSLLDVAAIAAAGTGLYITLLGLGLGHIGWIGAVGTYGLGNAVATLSAMPGGLGANEDVSTAVLSHMGATSGSAAAGTLIFRAFTLAFGTLIGVTVLLLCRQRFQGLPARRGERLLALE